MLPNLVIYNHKEQEQDSKKGKVKDYDKSRSKNF